VIFDLGFVADAFATGTYPVRRVPTRARNAVGKLQPPVTVEDTTITASVQPAEDEELRDPEGNYADSGWIIITRAELGLSRDGYEADFIQIQGSWFRVTRVKSWGQAAGFTRAVALIADDPPEPAP
jgi:hypothetical protein